MAISRCGLISKPSSQRYPATLIHSGTLISARHLPNHLPWLSGETAPMGRQTSQAVGTAQGVRLQVPESGLYSLTLAQLSAAGVPAPWLDRPTYLRLWRGTTEIPRVISGNTVVFYLPPMTPATRVQAG
jgi:hypothetical protein